MAREKKRLEVALKEAEMAKLDVESLRAELIARPTVEELHIVKRQARLFQRIAFNDNSDSDGCNDTNMSNSRNSQEMSNVDELLLSRVKQLEAQLSAARITEDELTLHNQNITALAESAEMRAKESEKLVSRLESELEQRTKLSNNIFHANDDATDARIGRQQQNAGDQGLSELLGLENDQIVAV